MHLGMLQKVPYDLHKHRLQFTIWHFTIYRCTKAEDAERIGEYTQQSPSLLLDPKPDQLCVSSYIPIFVLSLFVALCNNAHSDVCECV